MGAMPPESGEEGAGGVGGDVERIGGAAGEPAGSGDFAEDGPDEEVEKDFCGGGRVVVGAEAEFPVEEEHRRKRAGDKQEVVEVGVKKVCGSVRFEDPAIEGVEEAAAEKEAVEQVAERRCGNGGGD